MPAPVIRTVKIQQEVYVSFKDLINALEQEKGISSSVITKLWKTLKHYENDKLTK